MDYDLVLWDLDGTIYNYKKTDGKYLYSGIRKTLSKINSKRQGVVTNNPNPIGVLKTLKLTEYFNKNLILNPLSEVDRILESKELKKKYFLNGNFGENFQYLEKQVMKPNPYMLNRIIEITKANPQKCLMIGDSFEDVISAQLASFKSIYLKGLEDCNCNVELMGLKPDWTLRIGDIKGLEKIIFSKH